MTSSNHKWPYNTLKSNINQHDQIPATKNLHYFLTDETIIEGFKNS